MKSAALPRLCAARLSRSLAPSPIGQSEGDEPYFPNRRGLMLRRSLAALALICAATPALAQEPVVGVANPEALFTDKDPVIHKNKQATLRIMRELLQCNHWSDAG